MAEGKGLARLESLIEDAFGSLPIPPRDTILGWMLNGAAEEDWVLAAFGDKRYSDVDPKVLDSIILTQILSPSAFAYYVGSAALAAARWPTEREGALVNSFAYDETPAGTLPEEYAELDLPRAEAIREILAHVRAERLREERAFWAGKDLFFRSEGEEEHVALENRAQGTIGRVGRLLRERGRLHPPRGEP